MAKNQRNGKRKDRESSRYRTEKLGHYLIVTDTEQTEKNYFEGLKHSLPIELQKQIEIKVVNCGTKDLIRVSKMHKANSPNYCQLWIVFDKDEVKEFDDIINKAELDDIKVGWSNPCIEVWFEAYFNKISNSNDNSVKCNNSFKKLYKQKTNQSYKKNSKNIYKQLCEHGNEEQAIQFAKQKYAEKSVEKSPTKMCPATTVHLLVDEIRNKVNNINEK